MLQKYAESLVLYFTAAANHVVLRLQCQKLRYACRAKIISTCSAYFLAEYFAEVLQVFASFAEDPLRALTPLAE